MIRAVAVCAALLLIIIAVWGLDIAAWALDDAGDAASTPSDYVAAPDATVAPDAVATPDATEADAPANAPIPPTIRAAEPSVITAPSDAGTVAAPGELAALSSALVVPVQGVERSQLHDTFTELRGNRLHEAIDILAPRGTPVVAATGGTLLKLFDSKAGGLMVYAGDPSGRFILLYGHLDSFAPGLSDGMTLVRGQVIGYVGTTGNAAPDTPHLHFAILRGEPAVAWWEGVPVNPYPLLVPPR